jgi:hypothetical protein
LGAGGFSLRSKTPLKVITLRGGQNYFNEGQKIEMDTKNPKEKPVSKRAEARLF